MRNPCKECDYCHKENNTCQSKKCCTSGDGYITWIDRLFCKPYKYNADRKTESSSEKPNNCEHITEDGVTCAKYPACGDCLDNPLNKVKGSERLVKGSEQTDCLDRYDRKTEPTISKMEQVDKDINVRSKDEPKTSCKTCRYGEVDEGYVRCAYYSKATDKDEPQADCNGCKFVGTYDTEFPCANCRRKTKDYYAKDEPQTERSSE